MAKYKVSSKNQSGGITAGKVNGASMPPDSPRENKTQIIFYWMVGIATVAGAVFAGLQYLKT